MNSYAIISTAFILLVGTSMLSAQETNVVGTAPVPPTNQVTSAPPTSPSRRSAAVETYVDREGWQSGVGLRGMEHYVERLANHVQKNIPGLIAGVAGGKRGILLITTYRGRRNFYRAKENTEQFLKAIVNDLATRLPEPVAAQVIVRYNGADIIIAERVRGEVRVKFLE